MEDATTDLVEDLDEALEQVIAAARAHLAAVKTADGAIDDETVWRSYVSLNNASFAYDQMLLDRYGEVTPWETDEIDLRVPAEGARPPYLTGGGAGIGESAPDPYPAVVSVRQRRDYRVPDVAALMAVAEDAAQRMALDDGAEPLETVADAVLELVRDGDGSLAGLDLPELEPLAGVVAVTEVSDPLDLDDEDTTRLFQIGATDRIVGRLDEEPYAEQNEGDSGPDEEQPDAGPDEEQPDAGSGETRAG